jgi:arylsulfatase A-like enzyme
VHHRVVETVDIAPTLAALLGVRPLQAVDGRVLPEVVGGAAPAASARGAARRAQ